MKIANTQDGDWFPDTGATDHITGNLGNLYSLTPYNGHDGVMVGNGQILLITHIGQAHIGSPTSLIQLNDVLLVPQIKKVLLFVSKLTSDFSLIFEFDGNGFLIKDKSTNKVVAKGSKRGGLYALDGDSAAFISHRF